MQEVLGLFGSMVFVKTAFTVRRPYVWRMMPFHIKVILVSRSILKTARLKDEKVSPAVGGVCGGVRVPRSAEVLARDKFYFFLEANNLVCTIPQYPDDDLSRADHCDVFAVIRRSPGIWPHLLLSPVTSIISDPMTMRYNFVQAYYIVRSACQAVSYERPWRVTLWICFSASPRPERCRSYAA